MSGRNPSVIARNLKPIGKNTLVGSVEIEVPAWRFKFKGCLWHQKGDKEWITFLGRERPKDGQRQVADLIEITDTRVAVRWKRAALDSVVHAIAGGKGA